MKNLMCTLISSLTLYSNVWAASAANTSSSTGVFKMVSGLVIVLTVMAVIAWIMKRLLPNITSQQQSVARVISSVSVGTRERVVVVQVADRWIVVGVAPGQVNGIANLEAVVQQYSENSDINNLEKNTQTFAASLSPSFSEWLQKSTAKIINKSGVNNK